LSAERLVKRKRVEVKRPSTTGILFQDCRISIKLDTLVFRFNVLLY
jgi:hypothetical protein